MVYKAGIVGCGRIAGEFDSDPKRKWIATHAGAYGEFPGTGLAAAADIDKEKLGNFGKTWDVDSLYADYKEMLKKEGLDFLSICTWGASHLDILRDAVDSGVKAIWCEKPIADRLESADEMIELCKEKNVVLIINHQRRYDTLHRKIREFISEGKLGKIQEVAFFYTAGIANSGSHMLDLLRFFFGDVDWIHAAYKNENNIADDPDINGLIRFKNEVNCAVQACDSSSYGIFEMDILGEKGRINLTDLGFSAEFYEVKESDLFTGYRGLHRTESPFGSPKVEYMTNAIKDMVECVEKGKVPESSGEDGRAALELICAFHESAMEDGKRIRLPLKDSKVEIKSK